MAITVGCAPDSWGVWFPNDQKQIPWNRFLDEVVQAGFGWIELGPHGYLPTDKKRLSEELCARNLHASAIVVTSDLEDPACLRDLNQQLLQAGELLASVQGTFVVLIDDSYTDVFTGKQIAASTLNKPAWEAMIHNVHQAGELVRTNFGLDLVFHPCAETHVEYADQIERFLDQTDPACVSLCFDTGHYAYRDGDPLQFMRRHRDRISYLHLKNINGNVMQQVVVQALSLPEAVEMGVFCEPELGAIDFIALRDLLHEIKYDGFAIVEQDMYPTTFDKPLPIARRTRAYLRRVGIG